MYIHIFVQAYVCLCCECDVIYTFNTCRAHTHKNKNINFVKELSSNFNKTFISILVPERYMKVLLH